MFSTTVRYGDQDIRVESESFAELHQAVARIQELGRDAEMLKRKSGCTHVALRYFVDAEKNEYFGFIDPETRANVGFGQYKDKKVIPFFAKGEEGFYAPDGAPQESKSRNGGKGVTAPAQRPQGTATLDPHDY